MPQLIRQVVGVQAPHQVLRIVVVCIEPRQQQNKVGVAEADVFLLNVRDIVKVAAGGVVVDFVVMHCRVPCSKLSVPCLLWLHVFLSGARRFVAPIPRRGGFALALHGYSSSGLFIFADHWRYARMSPEPLLPESSPLPKLHEFMPAVLSYLSDGSVRTSKEIRSAVAETLGLSSRQLAAKLPSGRLVYADRTYWAYKYLEQWGAVNSPQHAHFVITDKGRGLMAQYPHGVPAEASSCTEGLEVMRKKVIEALEHKIVNGLKPGEPDFSRLRMYDAVQFAADNMLDKLAVSAPLPSIALHPTCSMTHLGTQPAFEKIANAMSADVYVPKNWGCCGYAGDRGMLHPELSEQKQFAAYISANRTCEQGMTEATGHTYQNVLQLLERTTR